MRDRERTTTQWVSRTLATVSITYKCIIRLCVACYFNSLIQAYFYIPQFTDKILKNAVTHQNQIASSNIEREKACNTLAFNLAGLFTKMIMSNRKYTEPSNVLRALVDDFGQPILFGD
jgi:hypothetical protein